VTESGNGVAKGMARRSRRAENIEAEGPANKKGKLGKVAGFLDMPQGTIAKSQMEIIGNNELIVDGVQGVLEYDESYIRVSLGKMLAKITGRNLTLKAMGDESIVVDGYILSIEFE